MFQPNRKCISISVFVNTVCSNYTGLPGLFFFFSKYNYCTVPAIFIFQNPFPPSIPTQIVPLSFRHLSYNSGTALPCLTHPAGQVTWVPQNWTWKAIDKFQTKLKGSQIAIPVRHYIFLDAFMLVHRFVLWNMLGGYF